MGVDQGVRKLLEHCIIHGLVTFRMVEVMCLTIKSRMTEQVRSTVSSDWQWLVMHTELWGLPSLETRSFARSDLSECHSINGDYATLINNIEAVRYNLKRTHMENKRTNCFWMTDS